MVGNGLTLVGGSRRSRCTLPHARTNPLCHQERGNRLPRTILAARLHVRPLPRSTRTPGLNGGQGLLADELPLRSDLSLAPEQLQRLLVVKRRKEIQEACCCIAANAILAYSQGARIDYSWDNSFSAAVRAGAPSWFSRRAVASAVEHGGRRLYR